MANEMTIQHTHKEATAILDRVITELELDIDFTLRQRAAATSFIEERLDAIINEWDLAREEIQGEADTAQSEVEERDGTILALRAELEEAKRDLTGAQENAAVLQNKVDQLERDLNDAI